MQIHPKHKIFNPTGVYVVLELSDQINTMGVGIKVIGVYSTISQAKLYITPERILKGPIPYYDNSVHYNEPIPFGDYPPPPINYPPLIEYPNYFDKNLK